MDEVLLKVNLVNCQRCHEDHDDVVFELLINPSDEYNYWAMCPEINQPVLLTMKMIDYGNHMSTYYEI